MQPDLADAHEVGRRLRRLRERLGVRPEQVALAMCTSAGNYNHYETGRQRLRLDQLPAIADGLGATVDYVFMQLAGYPAEDGSTAADRPSPGNTGEHGRTPPDPEDKALTVKTDQRSRELVGAR